jgi:hypothetical protein
MCRVDSQIFYWRLHFLIQIIVLAACLQNTAGFACKLHATSGQSHINCTRVADSRMKILLAWPPVAYNMNKIGRNLHATGGHAGTICMRLAATRVQFACALQIWVT